MPYIKQEQRGSLAANEFPKEAGELNYLFTRACVEATDVAALEKRLVEIAENYWLGAPAKYQRINDVLGALEGARREWKRRKGGFPFDSSVSRAAGKFYDKYAGPYEDPKIVENGDVYD